MNPTPETAPPFFWLHVKKSAGQSTRALLQPHYALADRKKRVQNFPESPMAFWNDILNNYRVPLGAYQFRRCLYARDFLYKDHWPEMVRFAFSREPLDRCLSAFFYLGGAQFAGRRAILVNAPLRSARQFALGYAFDRFLSHIEEVRVSNRNQAPHGLHFATHTAAMWPDICDDDGTPLLSHVFDLADLHKGLGLVFDLCDLAQPADDMPPVRRNETQMRGDFTPSRAQLNRVETLYADDFALHHDRVHRFAT